MILFNAISLYSAVCITWYGVSIMIYNMSLLYLNLKDYCLTLPVTQVSNTRPSRPSCLQYLSRLRCSQSKPCWGSLTRFIPEYTYNKLGDKCKRKTRVSGRKTPAFWISDTWKFPNYFFQLLQSEWHWENTGQRGVLSDWWYTSWSAFANRMFQNSIYGS